MQTIVATEVFGQIRALVPFRLTGGNRDYIIVGSDSGRIVILEYSKEKNSFIKVGRNYNMRGSVKEQRRGGSRVYMYMLVLKAGNDLAGAPGDFRQVGLPPHRAGRVPGRGPQGPRLHDRGCGEAEAGA
jgi:hypothetical protein